MNNPSQDSRTTVFCGIDVSAATLAAAVIEQDQATQQREFPNQPAGHKQLLLWLAKRQTRVRVSLEATGIYSLDLALALDAAPQVEVAVLNPKLVNRFAQTLSRSKSDAADAIVLAQYSQRMPFLPWPAPSSSGLALRRRPGTSMRWLRSRPRSRIASMPSKHRSQHRARWSTTSRKLYDHSPAA
jgi:transposase